MKKRKRIIVLVIIVVLASTVTGCMAWKKEDKQSTSENSPFERIENEIVYNSLLENYTKTEDETKVFVYDKYTNIVYYMFSSYNYDLIEEGHTYTYFTIFTTQNDLHCKYDPQTKTVSEIKN